MVEAENTDLKGFRQTLQQRLEVGVGLRTGSGSGSALGGERRADGQADGGTAAPVRRRRGTEAAPSRSTRNLLTLGQRS